MGKESDIFDVQLLCDRISFKLTFTCRFFMEVIRSSAVSLFKIMNYLMHLESFGRISSVSSIVSSLSIEPSSVKKNCRDWFAHVLE